jgi:hypothetical protein
MPSLDCVQNSVVCVLDPNFALESFKKLVSHLPKRALVHANYSKLAPLQGFL